MSELKENNYRPEWILEYEIPTVENGHFITQFRLKKREEE